MRGAARRPRGDRRVARRAPRHQLVHVARDGLLPELVGTRGRLQRSRWQAPSYAAAVPRGQCRVRVGRDGFERVHVRHASSHQGARRQVRSRHRLPRRRYRRRVPRGRGARGSTSCVANRSASTDATINGTLHIDVLDETSGPAPTPAPTPSPTPAPAPGDAEGSGRACTSDGTCNPGNDGAGEICTAGRCVAGCRTSAQCPGSKSCVSGQCR